MLRGDFCIFLLSFWIHHLGGVQALRHLFLTHDLFAFDLYAGLLEEGLWFGLDLVQLFSLLLSLGYLLRIDQVLFVSVGNQDGLLGLKLELHPHEPTRRNQIHHGCILLSQEEIHLFDLFVVGNQVGFCSMLLYGA